MFLLALVTKDPDSSPVRDFPDLALNRCGHLPSQLQRFCLTSRPSEATHQRSSMQQDGTYAQASCLFPQQEGGPSALISPHSLTVLWKRIQGGMCSCQRAPVLHSLVRLLFSMFLLDQVSMVTACFPTRSQLVGAKIWGSLLKVPIRRRTSFRARHQMDCS